MRRHVLVVTEATYQTIRRALSYCIENAEAADFDGDHAEADVRSFTHAKDAIATSNKRDVTRDRRALWSLAEIAADQCSCTDRVGRDPADHDRGCWYLIHKRDIDRVRELAGVIAPELARLETSDAATPSQPHP